MMAPAPAGAGVTSLAMVAVGLVSLLNFIPGLSVFGSDEDESGGGDVDISEHRLEEAARRLENSGESVSGEALQQTLREIEQEESADASPRGVASPEQRGDAQTMAVAPDKIEEHGSYIVRKGEHGKEKYVRQLIVSSFPNRVTYGWLDQLFTSEVNVRIAYHIWPKDPESMLRQLNIRSTRLRSQLQRKREKGKINTSEEEQQLGQIERLRDQLTQGDTKLFDFALYIEVIADNEQELDEESAEVRQILAQSNARVTPLYDRQLDAQRSVAPLGQDPVLKTQVMDTRALGTTFPFIEPSIVEPSGVLFGFHNITGTPVVVDRFELSGHNMLISGKIGSGKSYLAKLSIWRRLQMDPETNVLIIDPVGGMGDLVDAVGGQHVEIGGASVINPLELEQSSAAGQEDLNPYEQKIRSVMGMFSNHFEGRRELSKEEEGILRRALRLAYLSMGITPDVETHANESPTIQDVLDVLGNLAEGDSPSEFLDVAEELEPYIESIEIDDDEDSENDVKGYAHSLLLGLEDFQEGGQNQNLNGVTNVELQNRVVQFDLSQSVDKGSAPLMMHVVLDWLFQRAKASDGKTIVAIDEAHYMLGQPEALDMLELFARHSRHYNSGMTLISQTVDEFMQSEEAKAIYDQCDIRALMRHEHIGDDALEALDLTEREKRFVLQAQAGNSAPYSESLLYVTDIGKIWLQVLSNGYEHSVIEEDENAWAYLYEHDIIDWEDLPEEQRLAVRKQMQGR